MGLLCRAGTFRLLLMGLGNFARIEEIIMTKRNFEKSVRTLKRIRDTYYSQLDISVVTELNAVIAELEKADSQLNAQAGFGLARASGFRPCHTSSQQYSGLDEMMNSAKAQQAH